MNAASPIGEAAAGPSPHEITDGIYFGLPMDTYCKVPRLGASDLQNLNVSPADFWRGSWLDPDRDTEEEEKGAWEITGEAYHCARLEPDAFEQRFARKPCRDDYADLAKSAGACWNGKEIEAQLERLGKPKKFKDDKGVRDQAFRLEEAGYEGVIWPLIEARFEDTLGTRQAIEAKVWDEIVRDMGRIRGSPEIVDKLSGGAAEVSVFWTDRDEIQRKARFDYLKVTSWADIKTFDNSRGKRLEQAIADAFRFYRYYLTAASYREASEAVRTGGLQIIGEATDAERKLIAELQISQFEQECWFIFQQKKGVPNLLGRKFEFFDVPWETKFQEAGATEEQIRTVEDATRRPTQIYQKGLAEISYAKHLFALYSEIYRPGVPWAPFEPLGTINDSSFNPNWLEGKYE